MSDALPIKRALVAVADKSNVVEFARGLVDRGVKVVSTGNTARVLQEAGIDVTPVSAVTGFPEMLEGRVKTLHPRIHGGILADKQNPSHLAELEEHGIEPFDLVVVNLYPFLETVVSGAPAPEVIEQIDIGGPAMVRAAAKNFESVGVVVRPDDYGAILYELDSADGLSRNTRYRLAREAFAHTSAYDTAIAAWFAEEEAQAKALPPEEEGLPKLLSIALSRRSILRYGENPHQRAGLYTPEAGLGPLGGAEVLQGKEMSFNNWLDTEAARAVAFLFDRPAAAIVKHHNPCGVALGSSLPDAYSRALDGDRVSAFGGIVAFNREVDEDAARAMAEVFTEVVVAPAYSEGALAAYAAKANLRVLRAPAPEPRSLDVRFIDGGALVQDMDQIVEGRSDMKVVTSREPTEEEWEDLLFAWTVAARVKSNAIVLAKGLATVAVGAGQMNRLTSVDVASRHAGGKARGASLASDAFFPFRDGLDRAAEAGIAAVIQPGGSVRDEEVIASAEEHGLAMVFTGRRHFRH
ncbi:MAG TPA: bifunctional phosphoribosylaminoimidazolecarboxamide formyltransferase/IMP cyclohydrolase [Actinomycetota bacterium]|jgi:phosphoribosylaminoimidazolecarboxamide formyltransferase/IMP cyclohydrolase